MFFLNLPIGIVGLVLVLLLLPDYRSRNTKPLDLVGMILFGSGIALLSYVLEIFGDHRLSLGEILGLSTLAISLLVGYGLYASRTVYPLLDLALFRIRTFSAAVSGGFFTRLGIGGFPFLLPLLYQVGLGFTPIQSGLLIMPQAIAALATKFLLPFILARFGYRMVLIGNTVMLGLLMTAFALIGPDTSVWAIVALGACNGIVQSLQYTSMNTLVYSDIPQSRASNASSLSGALQQLSISFGIAAAGLTTVLFVPQSVRSNPAEFLHGIHEAFVALGTFTVLSSVLFWRLRSQDGGAVSLKREVRIGGQGA